MLSPKDYPSADLPVLIAGPTASGKSALAARLAEAQGRTVVNADALQAWRDWRVLTARPSPADEGRAPHALFGHLGWDEDWSVGHWLRAVAPMLGNATAPIVVGGTGLAFRALTEGLAEIPAVSPEIRTAARDRPPAALLAEIDPITRGRIDHANPARVRRAWEVLMSTGRPLAEWQDDTPPPILGPKTYAAFRTEVPKHALNDRIAARFDAMLTGGALDEARANLARDRGRPAARAIGAPELFAYLEGALTLEDARAKAIVSTRRYAKRQRTWLRARMAEWTALSLS